MEFYDLLPDLGGSFTVFFYVTELSIGNVLHNQLFGEIIVDISLLSIKRIDRFARPWDLANNVTPYLTDLEKGN